jgi:hypothetical protein
MSVNAFIQDLFGILKEMVRYRNGAVSVCVGMCWYAERDVGVFRGFFIRLR